MGNQLVPACVVSVSPNLLPVNEAVWVASRWGRTKADITHDFAACGQLAVAGGKKWQPWVSSSVVGSPSTISQVRKPHLGYLQQVHHQGTSSPNAEHLVMQLSHLDHTNGSSTLREIIYMSQVTQCLQE